MKGELRGDKSGAWMLWFIQTSLEYPARIGNGFTAAGLAVHLFLLAAKQMALPLKMGFVSLILVGNVKWTWGENSLWKKTEKKNEGLFS